MKSTVHICPHCNTLHTTELANGTLTVCRRCNSFLLPHSNMLQTSTMPVDWSFIQLGTVVEYQQHQLKIVGRVRLQLRNDYKNFWCAALANGKDLWLMESFASFALFTPTWRSLAQDVNYPKPGVSVKLPGKFKVRGEYIDKCESIDFEGEIGDWKLLHPGFYFVQASNNVSQTAVFTIANSQIDYLSGKKVEAHNMNFKNIIQWDEWK